MTLLASNIKIPKLSLFFFKQYYLRIFPRLIKFHPSLKNAAYHEILDFFSFFMLRPNFPPFFKNYPHVHFKGFLPEPSIREIP